MKHKRVDYQHIIHLFFFFFFSLKGKWNLFVMWSKAWCSSNAQAHLQVEKEDWGNFGVCDKSCRGVLTSGLLYTRNYKHRKWEKEVERGRELSFSSIVQPAHLTLLLIVWSNKGGWQRWCCSIDRLVMGAMKGPRGWWMGQLECSCKMTVFRERQQWHARKTHSHIFSCIRHAWMHSHTCSGNLHSLN